MNGHLNDEQWAMALLDPAESTVAEHLRECPACRAERGSFHAAIGKARTEIRQASDRPEGFWNWQRTAISTRLPKRRFAITWRRLAWVTATIVLVVLSTSLLSRRNAPAPPPPVSASESDDTLLLSVQESIGSDLPQALRPAALLAQEVNQAEIVGSRTSQPQGD
jgi:hypothetical protein